MIYLPERKDPVRGRLAFAARLNPNAPLNAVPNLVHWYEAVQRLNLDVEQIYSQSRQPDDARGRARKIMDVHQSSQVWAK